MEYTEQLFTSAVARSEQLEYNPNWANGTGYFNQAVRGEHAPSLEPGTMKWFVDNIGRKAILVGTFFGNVVIFKRYREDENKVYVMNVPFAVKDIISQTTGAVTEDTMFYLIGTECSPNIGQRINGLIEDYKKLQLK